MSKYNMSSDKDKDEGKDTHGRAVKKLDELRKLDENNPMERAIKFDMVKKYPPKPGFMKVDVFDGVDSDGNRIAISQSSEKTLFHDPIMSIDLNTSIGADVAACPSNVMPMLIDEYVQIAMEEKKDYKPEKPETQFNWWWIVFFLLMIPGIITVILFFV